MARARVSRRPAPAVVGEEEQRALRQAGGGQRRVGVCGGGGVVGGGGRGGGGESDWAWTGARVPGPSGKGACSLPQNHRVGNVCPRHSLTRPLAPAVLPDYEMKDVKEFAVHAARLASKASQTVWNGEGPGRCTAGGWGWGARALRAAAGTPPAAVLAAPLPLLRNPQPAPAAACPYPAAPRDLSMMVVARSTHRSASRMRALSPEDPGHACLCTLHLVLCWRRRPLSASPTAAARAPPAPARPAAFCTLAAPLQTMA